MLRKKGGFTLVELVVALGLSAIIMITGMWVVQYFTRANRQAEYNSQAQQLAKMQLEYIEAELRYAFSLKIDNRVPTELQKDFACLFVQEGKIMRKDPGHTGVILSDVGFERYEYRLRFSSQGEDVLKTEIWVSAKGEDLFYTHASFFVSNLDDGIEGSSGTTVVYDKVHKPVTGITITSPHELIARNGPIQLSAVVYPINASNRGVLWGFAEGQDYRDRAEITEDGKLIPLQKGKVRVKATALDGSGVFEEKDIEIKDFVMVESLKVVSRRPGSNINTSTMRMGESLVLVPQVSPNNATNKKVRWHIMNNSHHANIDENNVLTVSPHWSLGSILYIQAYTTDGSDISLSTPHRIIVSP